jgi:hypothetical protein
VVVSPRASELIHVVSLAVSMQLTVDQVSDGFTVYPSLSGSVAEAGAACTDRFFLDPNSANTIVVVPQVRPRCLSNGEI